MKNCKTKEDYVVDHLMLILQPGEEKRIHLVWTLRTAHLPRGEALTAHTLKFCLNNFQVNKLYEKPELSFVEDRKYEYCSGKDDQKSERVIHEIAKAKLSVCYLLVVHNLNNNSVIITYKQNNFEQKYKLRWSSHATIRQHGVGIVIK